MFVGGFVEFDEVVVVGGVHKKHIEAARVGVGVSEGLFQAVFDGVGIVFGFDDGQRQVRDVVKGEIGAFSLAACPKIRTAPADDDAPGGVGFLPDDLGIAPTRFLQGGQDEFIFDLFFEQAFFVKRVHVVTGCFAVSGKKQAVGCGLDLQRRGKGWKKCKKMRVRAPPHR